MSRRICRQPLRENGRCLQPALLLRKPDEATLFAAYSDDNPRARRTRQASPPVGTEQKVMRRSIIQPDLLPGEHKAISAPDAKHFN